MADSPLDRPALATLQLARLQALLRSVRPGNSFYERKLAAAGAPAQVQSLEEFTARFPFTTKQELVEDQQQHPPYGTNLGAPLDSFTRFHQTSGTSGHPLRWLDTPESWADITRCWMRVFRAANVGRGDRVLFAFTFGPFIGFWAAFAAAEHLGCLCLPAGGLGSSARLRMLLDNQATVLCCTPTYAMRLADVAAAEGMDLATSRVRVLLVAGEPGGSIPAVRDRLSLAWHGARIFDHHGMTEVGPVTHECTQHPCRLHVIESSYLPEVIDPLTGHPLPPGREGELVLTTLGRTGMPLLRYRTGDRVRTLPGPCSCGQADLALEGGILGRADDMVIVRGVNVYPAAIEAIVQRCGGVAEYQVEVFSRPAGSELTLRLEAAPGAGDPTSIARRVQQALQDALALRIPVTPVPPDSLPRYELKARRWVHVDTALPAR